MAGAVKSTAIGTQLPLSEAVQCYCLSSSLEAGAPFAVSRTLGLHGEMNGSHRIQRHVSAIPVC
jgi:hypothetical protein